MSKLTRKAVAKADVVKKAADGVEIYVLRTPDGEVLNLSVTASSTASMDKAVEDYAEALKRLAKR